MQRWRGGTVADEAEHDPLRYNNTELITPNSREQADTRPQDRFKLPHLIKRSMLTIVRLLQSEETTSSSPAGFLIRLILCSP